MRVVPAKKKPGFMAPRKTSSMHQYAPVNKYTPFMSHIRMLPISAIYLQHFFYYQVPYLQRGTRGNLFEMMDIVFYVEMTVTDHFSTTDIPINVDSQIANDYCYIYGQFKNTISWNV